MRGGGQASCGRGGEVGGGGGGGDGAPLELRRQDSLQDSYHCAITKEIFLQPVTLGCGHSFEKDAVEKEVAQHGSSAKCPVCKEPVRRQGDFKVRFVPSQDSKATAHWAPDQACSSTPAAPPSPPFAARCIFLCF